jgi:hypothetical protein
MRQQQQQRLQQQQAPMGRNAESVNIQDPIRAPFHRQITGLPVRKRKNYLQGDHKGLEPFVFTMSS